MSIDLPEHSISPTTAYSGQYSNESEMVMAPTSLRPAWILRAGWKKMSRTFDNTQKRSNDHSSTLTDSSYSTAATHSRLSQVAANVPGAMELCINQYGSLVWNLVKRHISSHSTAEDIVQEIFTEIWKSAYRFDASKGNEITFIATIARRRAIDWVRRQNTALSTVELPENYDQVMVSPSQDEESTGDHEEIASLLQALPEQTRRLFDMHYKRGLTQEEIARQIDMPLGTVKTLLRRGLLDIRARLSRISSSSSTASVR